MIADLNPFAFSVCFVTVLRSLNNPHVYITLLVVTAAAIISATSDISADDDNVSDNSNVSDDVSNKSDVTDNDDYVSNDDVDVAAASADSFYYRVMYMLWCSVCPLLVRLSVTLVYCVETTTLIIKQLALDCSLETVVY